jgi:hypothetical protein
MISITASGSSSVVARCSLLGENSDAVAQINEIERAAHELANSITKVDG